MQKLKKDDQQQRNTKQTNKKLTRPNNPANHRRPSNARIRINGNNTKELWRQLWSKHNISPAKYNEKEKIPKVFLGYG